MTDTGKKEPVLRIRDLSVSFATDEGNVKAVQRVSLDLFPGETLGLVGESGCGKSVTAMSCLRLIPSPPGRIEAGQALFRGRDLLRIPAADLRRVRGNAVGMIFQEPMTALSPLHRVGKQLAEGIRLHRDVPRTEAWRTGEEWLRKVGIPDPGKCMYGYPHQLSGGMRQRVMIAMALMLSPEIVIADEPTTALDVTIQAQVLDIIRGMIEKRTSLLLITHDMGVIWEMCSRVAVMYSSEIVEEGPIADVFETPLHPYTEALLESVPSLQERRGRLATIKGQVPSPLHFVRGCRFRDRCKYAFERCGAEHPPLYGVRGRLSRCFLREHEDDAR